MKIFCGFCKHSTRKYYGLECLSKGIQDDTYYRPRMSYTDCDEKNKKNDCKEYEPSFITRLFRPKFVPEEK